MKEDFDRRTIDRCERCGYEFSDSNIKALCPECRALHFMEHPPEPYPRQCHICRKQF